MAKKKTTKNGVDINEIDVSTLTLVDKEDLLEDLSKKLKGAIREAFQQGVDGLKDDIVDMVGGNSGNSSGGGPARPRRVSSPSGNSGKKSKNDNDDFEKMRKIEASTKELLDKLTTLQKKKDKEKRIKQQRGNVYSDAGRRHSNDINDVASEYHTYSKDELEAAKKKVADIHESVRFTTFGQENKVLTNATLSLQKALEQETQKRTTTLGKIGMFLNKQNIDAVSIISGLSGHSPIVGLATKFILDKIRDQKEIRQRAKADKFKVDIKKALPRPDEPILDDNSIKHDPDTVKEHLGKVKDEDVRHSALENLHAKGKITTEQHQNLRAELISPGYQPPWEREAAMAQQQQQTHPSMIPPTMQLPTLVPTASNPIAPTASTPTPVAPGPAGNSSTAPQQILRDHLGNPVPDWQEYQKTSKKQQALDERDAWLNMMRAHGKNQLQHQHQVNQNNKPGSNWDTELFGEFNAKPSALSHLEKQEAERLKNPYNNPVKPMMVPGAAKVRVMPTFDNLKSQQEEQFSQARVTPTFDNLKKQQEEQFSQARVMPTYGSMMQQAAAPQLVRKHHVQDDPETILHPEQIPSEKGMFSKDGPFSKLEKLNEEQLEELKTINKQLAKQIDQADLAAAAKLRETKDGGMSGALPNILGVDDKKKTGKGGILGTLASGVETGIAKLFGGKIGKWLGLGAKEEKVAGGAARVAEGAEGAGGAVKAVEGVEGLAKGGSKLAGEGGELLKGAKLLGKAGRLTEFLDFIPVVGEVILAITAIFDFIPAFMHAEKFLGNKKKLTTLDRVAGGIGGVVEGIVGIADFLLGLVGIKSNLGGFFGKLSAKIIQTDFKLLKVIFVPIYNILKMAAKLANKLPWDKLEKLAQPFFDWIEKFGDFLEGVVDVMTSSFEDDPQKAIKEGGDKIVEAIKGMFKSLIEMLIGPDTYKDLVDSIESLKGAMRGLIDWAAEKLRSLNPFAKNQPPPSSTPPPPGQQQPATKPTVKDVGRHIIDAINPFKSNVVTTSSTPTPSAAPPSVAPPSSSPTPTAAPPSVAPPAMGTSSSPISSPSSGLADTTKNLYGPTKEPKVGKNILDGFVTSGNPALDAMMQAIAQMEGNGYLHNNPGNVMDYDFFKKTNQFRLRTFDSMGEGWKYLANLLQGKLYLGNAKNNFFDIFGKFAPKGHGGNDPDRYAKFVASKLGVDPSQSASQQLLALQKKSSSSSSASAIAAAPSATNSPIATTTQPSRESGSATAASMASFKPTVTESEVKRSGPMPTLQAPPKLSAESPGMQLAQMSTQNSDLQRTSGQSDSASVINAPSTKITNNNSTHVADVKAVNTDTSYQRNQNAMFVPS